MFTKRTLAVLLLLECAHASLLLASVAGINAPGTTSYPQAGMRRVTKLTLSSDNYSGLYGGIIDPVNGYGYFGTAHGINPGWLIKVNLKGPLPVEVGAAAAASGEANFNSGAVDSAAGYAYVVCTGSTASHVLKFALGSGDNPPVYVGSILLLPGEYGGGTVIDTRDPDPANHYLYISTSGSPAEVVKVAPGAGNALPSRVSAVTMQPGENFLRRGAADLGNGYAYFATLSVSGTVYPTVVKIGLTAGSAPPTRIGAVQLDGATPYSIGSAVLDVGNGYGYFGTYDVPLVPAKVFKVSLGAGAAAPTLVGSVTLSAGPPAERELSTAVIDPASGYAFFGTDHTYAAKIFKIRLGAGNALPTEAGLVQLQSGTQPNPPDGVNVFDSPETLYGEVFLQSSMIDPVSGYAYWGTDSHRGQVVKTAISEKGALKGTRVVLTETAGVTDFRFYSHVASGNMRLALYDNGSPKNLMWDSGSIPNTAAGAWLTAPISAGFPSSLTLTQGTYWLAWQVDSTADVPSYSLGGSGDGFFLEQAYGSFPGTLGAEQSTSEQWSVYFDYNPVAPPSSTSFYTLTPCRLVDTRNSAGALAGPSLAAGSDRTFVLAGACGIPVTAVAAVLNITVTQPTSAGFLTLFPASASPPLASNVNYRPGQTRANNGIAVFGSAGDLTVRCGQSSGTVHLILDVTGYFQ
jgi:hypothetical protein